MYFLSNKLSLIISFIFFPFINASIKNNLSNYLSKITSNDTESIISQYLTKKEWVLYKTFDIK